MDVQNDEGLDAFIFFFKNETLRYRRYCTMAEISFIRDFTAKFTGLYIVHAVGGSEAEDRL